MTIDKTKPAPGFALAFYRSRLAHRVCRVALPEQDYERVADAIAESHRIYARECTPAVVDFAERSTAWLNAHRDEHGEYDCPAWHEWLGQDTEPVGFSEWATEQILAAARGERSL